MSELVTIIVPVYKVEEYLSRCVDSILSQTYTNLEILLINDGSPDNCGEICEEYAKLDNRIRVVHKKNGGLSDARNVGLELAKGDYITFLDSDDWIHSEYIKMLYEILSSTQSDISICNFVKTSVENVSVNNLNTEEVVYSNIEALEQMYGELNIQIITAWGKLFKKGLFDNIRFPVGRIHEDEFTTYKLIYKANKIVLTNAELLYYWQRNDSIMGTGFNLKHKLDLIDAYTERAQFFQQVGLDDLCAETCKSLFIIYLEVNNKKNEFDNKALKNKFNTQFKGLKNILKHTNQSNKFKIFYNIYYLAPIPVAILYKFYKKLRAS